MPDDFVEVPAAAGLLPGQMIRVAVDGRPVVIANVDGELLALRDVCGHRNAPLSRGRLLGCIVECPLHFAQFDMRTGRLVDGPISADVPTHSVRVVGGAVYVGR